jgi:hypothetical protein
MSDKDNKEIPKTTKKWLGYLALFFVIFHFTAILVTTFPVNYTSKTAQSYFRVYVKPLFSQRWSMFAPCPLTNHQLKFKLYYNNEQTDTITPSLTYFKYHSWLRFTHHGDLATGEYNLLYWIYLDLDTLNIEPFIEVSDAQKQEFYKTRGYFLLKNYLTGYALKSYHKKPISADVVLDYYNVKEKINREFIFKNLK